MRKLLALLAVALFATVTPPKVDAAINASVDIFYDSLEPMGDWIETPDYGFVWSPRDVGEDWRPYTDGSWAHTDAGWTWVSEEPHGWATYHYGRWTRIEDTGWVWVPDTQWGPAWVSWRRGGKHVGWAPLPPEAHFRRDVGIKEWSDSYYDVGPGAYTFVEVRHFGAPRITKVTLPPRENVTIIRETKNITNVTYVNNVVYNGGPEYDVIVRESAEPVRRLRLERRTDVVFDRGFRPETVRTRIEGDSLRIVAPEIRYVESAAPRRVTRRIDRVEVNRGWSVAGAENQVERLRTEIRSASPRPPAQLPQQPRYERLSVRAAAAENAPADQAATTPEQVTTERQRRAASGDTRGAVPPATANPGSVTSATDQPASASQTAVTTDPGSADANATGAATTVPKEQRGSRPTAEEQRAGRRGDRGSRDQGATTATSTPAPAKAKPGEATTTTDPATGATSDTTSTSASPAADKAATSSTTTTESDRPGRRERTRRGDQSPASDAASTQPGTTVQPTGSAPSDMPARGRGQQGTQEPPSVATDAARPDETTAAERARDTGATRSRPEDSTRSTSQRGERGRGTSAADRDTSGATGTSPADKQRPGATTEQQTGPSATTPERPERGERPERATRPGAGERPERSGRPERSSTPEKPEAAAPARSGERPDAGSRRQERPEGASAEREPAGDRGGRAAEAASGRESRGADRAKEAASSAESRGADRAKEAASSAESRGPDRAKEAASSAESRGADRAKEASTRGGESSGEKRSEKVGRGGDADEKKEKSEGGASKADR